MGAAKELLIKTFQDQLMRAVKKQLIKHFRSS
jgi:hypothetical protein